METLHKRREIARLQLRERYVSAKAELWGARVNGDAAAGPADAADSLV